jgi:hypothetical protein
MTTASSRSRKHPGMKPVQHQHQQAARSSWMTFAGLMLILAGSFTIIGALSAIQKSNYLDDHVLFSTLKGWGWFFLVWGCVEIAAGIGVLGRATWAILLGIVTAFVNALGQLSWAATYPVWAISAMVLDVIVIYGLMVHGLGEE